MADHSITLADFEALTFATGTKTQLRRPIAVTLRPGVNPRFSQLRAHPEGDGWRIHGSEEASDRFTVPYAVGDRLWVQEAWQVARETTDYETGGEYDVYDWDEDMLGDPRPYLNGCARYGYKAGLFYRADGEDENPDVFYPLIGVRDEVLHEAEIDWRPAEEMPRWASRLTLEVIGVRVERLTDITDGDALDEGVTRWAAPAHGPHSERGKPPLGPSPRTRFADFWDAIHGKGAFAQAPWVVALTLRVIPQDGDASAQAA